jgi:DNA-binding NtrC family response regulator
LLESFLGARAPEVSNAAIGTLMNLPWTGNVRELRNFAERVLAVGAERALAMATASEGAAEAESVPAAAKPEREQIGDATVSEDSSSSVTVRGPEGWLDGGFKDFRDRWSDIGEREYLRRLMLRTNKSSSLASREAQVDRTYLYRLLRRHNM